jgi:hypothetical protein
MADNVLRSTAFNELYTIYLNVDGNPVQRSLHEMTSGELVQVLKWSQAEADRLDFAAESATRIAKAVEQGRTDEVAHLTLGEFKAAALALRQAGDASERHAQLLSLVRAQIPQWRGSGVLMGEALRKWWPGGRRRH